MAKRIRVVTSSVSDKVEARPKPRVVTSAVNPIIPKLTENEMRARHQKRYATTTTFGYRTAGDTADSGTSNFYSPQLSSDFLEKPQNLRERRAFYRFFYNTNEIVGRAIDIHSTLPLSKLRLVPPKGKNQHQNKYIMQYFEKMCDEMKLFKTLIEVSHEYNLFGNCGAKWAEIQTDNGIKRIEHIREGDLVLTNQGRYRKVLKFFYREAEEILRIKCWRDFREIPVTDEHPIEILKDGKFQFIPAKELKLKDFVRITWPEEIEDTESVKLAYPSYYDVDEDKITLNFSYKHPRDNQAIEARKKFFGWIGSLKEPLIITREAIAKNLGIEIKTFHSMVYILGKEIDTVFHKRIGAKGFQKGSQVMWLPMDTSDIKVTADYTIYKKRDFKSIQEFKVDEDFCYLAGYWLGDGTLGRDSSRDTWGRGMWQINFKETAYENIDRIRNILQKIFGPAAISEWNSEGMKYLKVISNPAFNEWWADNFGETSRIRNIKRVPKWLVQLPLGKLKHFLAGVLDSDGCVTGGGVVKKGKTTVVSVSMISKGLMTGIRDVVLKCGGIVSFSKGHTPLKNNLIRLKNLVVRDIFIISSGDETTCKIFTEFSNKKIPDGNIFCADETHAFKRGPNGTLALKVKSIAREEYNDLVYNFEVEEDHTYQVAGFSTHNCFCFLEEDDPFENMTPEEIAKKKEEVSQRSEFLKSKYNILDKNPLFGGWKKLIILPPDQVRVRKLPLTDEIAVEYVPDPQTKEFITQGSYAYQGNSPSEKKKYDIPVDLQDKVRQNGLIPLDTDPYSGSFIFHLARKKSQYEPMGQSIIERCINTLTLLDKLRQAQTSIASRHMTPMRVIWAEDLNPEDVDNLREQVDMALVDPDFSIIGNYEIHWEEMGSNGRLLDIEGENNAGLDRLLAGLGMTREILTGEGSYTGSRIGLEIMNTEYLLFREVIQDFIENYLFKPVAKKKGFIEYDDYGNEILLYPKLSFTRLAIRDNDRFFDAAFQLYQKGSISIDLILDILNIDPVSTKEKIEQDLFTVNDSIFNELMRNIYTGLAVPLVDQTDLTDRVAKYLKLKMVAPAAEEAPAGAQRFSSNNKELIPEADREKAVKLAKIMKYLTTNPDLLDKVFSNVEMRS